MEVSQTFLTYQQRKLLSECGCVSDLNLKINANYCEFTNSTESICVERIERQFHKGQVFCECDQRCDEIYYSGDLENMTNW